MGVGVGCLGGVSVYSSVPSGVIYIQENSAVTVEGLDSVTAEIQRASLHLADCDGSAALFMLLRVA